MYVAILVLPVLDTRNILITISGIIMIVAGILITASYYNMKDIKQRKKVHKHERGIKAEAIRKACINALTGE